MIYVGDQGVPGAGAALERLSAAGYRLVFVTNNSTKTPEMVIEKVHARTGYGGEVAGVVTSGLATARWLEGRATRLLVLGGEGLVAALEASGGDLVDDWRRAEAVVVGLDPALSYERLTRAVLAVRNGAMFVASNADRTFPAPEGQYPGAGAIVAAVVAATGVEPVVCGKPHEATRMLVKQHAGEGGVLVIGDRPETDIAMGKAEGWATALVLSGVVDDPEHVEVQYRPDLVLSSIAELPEALQTR